MTDYRETLEEHIGTKVTVRGRIQKFGTRKKVAGRYDNYFITQDTVCLEEVTFLDGTPVCQHLWFDKTAWIRNQHPEEGDLIQISGWVGKYKHESGRENLCLNKVSGGKKIEETEDNEPLEPVHFPFDVD